MVPLAVIFIQVSLLIAAQPIIEQRVNPLGGIIPLGEKDLKSPEIRSRIESALDYLEKQNEGRLDYSIIKVINGTSQLVNGMNFVFFVEVESHSTECPGMTQSTSELYKLGIYEPSLENLEKVYTIKKINPSQ
ncbi:unnamed protein product [Hymenolepis diminuta]|uniref:Cystatin domain-containing protein n=1 Tax=Hymenolepis diminuta TaxID=6216 RepID=A0A0R3SPY6_HYMDI|nr:unnamed protein product [Hymenolepis diminuta]